MSGPPPIADDITPTVEEHQPESLDILGFSKTSPQEKAISSVVNPIKAELQQLSNIEQNGSTTGIAINGQYAYVARGDGGWAIYNITTPSLPILVFEDNLFRYSDIEYYSGYIYALAGSNIFILDVSNASQPWIVNRLYQSGARTIEIDNGRLHIGWVYGVEVWDLSAPASPVYMGEYDGNSEYAYIEMDGDVLYASSDGYTLDILDISDPTNITKINEFTSGRFNELVVQGDLLYVAGDSYNLIILNISDPLNIIPVYLVSSFEDATNVAVFGNYVYISDRYDGIRVFDVTDPSNPVLDTTYDDGYQTYEIHLTSNLVYIAGGRDGFEVFSTTALANPVNIFVAEGGGISYGLYESNNTLYLANGPLGVEIYDITSPTLPRKLARYNPRNMDAKDVMVVNDTLYVADQNLGLVLLNISDPTQPQPIVFNSPVSFDTRSVEIGVINGDTFAFLSGYYGLKILNLTDLDNPSTIFTYVNGTGFQYSGDSSQLHGNHLYFVDRTGFKIFDVSNITEISLLGVFNKNPVYDMVVDESLAYLANSGYGMAVVDITDPTNITEVGLYEPQGFGQPYSLTIGKINDYIIFADDLKHYNIINVTNPSNPTLIRNSIGIDWVWDMQVSGSYIYSAVDESGFAIHEFKELLLPTPPQNLLATYNGSAVILTWDTPASSGDAPVNDYLLRTGYDNTSLGWVGYIGPSMVYIDTNIDLFKDTKYYSLEAITSVGFSESSQIASVTFPRLDPDPPNLISVDLTDYGIEVSWETPVQTGSSPLSEISLIRYILINETIDVFFTSLASTDTYYLDTNITIIGDYYYLLSATNTDGWESSASGILNITITVIPDLLPIESPTSNPSNPPISSTTSTVETTTQNSGTSIESTSKSDSSDNGFLDFYFFQLTTIILVAMFYYVGKKVKSLK